jgi:hypothetical protein
MNDIKSKEYILLTNLELKTEVLPCCPCLLSLNAMSLSLAVDARRLTKCFELMLAQWQSCLPLGDACDVNFPLWGDKVWDMIKTVRKSYSLNKFDVNLYEYESASYMRFKESQAEVGALDGSIEPFRIISGSDVPVVVVCALRELHEMLMQISEFLNSPTEQQIAASFEQWQACYQKHYSKACQKKYNKWKIQYSPRTLRKNLQERMTKELEGFKKMFLSDDEFELVYDSELKRIDIDGLSRFLFTHAERFGVSHIDSRPMFSKELQRLFSFVELWRQMQADLQPAKKRSEKPAEVEDELEKKVMAVVAKVHDFASSKWSDRLPQLWKRLFMAFHSEIAHAGAHEKFKEFSKKTVYCILGHLKSKGLYRADVTNVELTIKLEGINNGMRKYVNNGLTELDQELKARIVAHVEQEMQALTA